jgi:poly-gamma-glutamate system protein
MDASAKMERAISVVREHLRSTGQQFDEAVDPNRTGLVGIEYSEITTTVGSVEAKRTTTNPQMAGVIVRLLEEAGVVRGDTIAVGCSGSFPALAIATLAASKTLGVYPVVILSVGASSFGATRTEFTLLEIYELLQSQRVFDVPAAAVSLGGARDVGADYEPKIRTRLIEKIQRSKIPFLYQPDLQRNVADRMNIYFGDSSKRRIAAFVNIGGNYADLGTSPFVLKLEPGVNKEIQIPPEEEKQGIVFAMAKRHISVIHLLHIKGLALKYGLPWDPIPLPKAEEERTASPRTALDNSFAFVAVPYFSLIIGIFILYRKEFSRTTH